MVLRHGIDALRDGTSCAIAGLPSPDPDTPGPMSGYPGFDALSRHLLQALKEQAATLVERDAQGHVRVGDDGQPVPRPADKQWLDAFTRLVVRRCGLPSDLFGISPAAIVIGYRIPRQPRTPDDTDFEPADSLINSCFIPDLRHLSELARQDRDGERLGLPLHRYLRGGPLSQPVDIRSRAGLEKARTLLEPDRFPQGAWPSDHPWSTASNSRSTPSGTACSRAPAYSRSMGRPVRENHIAARSGRHGRHRTRQSAGRAR